MKVFTSTIALIAFLLFPLVASGIALPQPGRDVLIEGTVEAVAWPHMKVVTDDGRTVRILMRDNNQKTFLPGDEIELYATCRGNGTECEFKAWDLEDSEVEQVRRAPILPDTVQEKSVASEVQQVRRAPIPEVTVQKKSAASVPEKFEFTGPCQPGTMIIPFYNRYALIYRASNEAQYTRIPSSKPPGGYFQWGGIITDVQYGPEDKVYIVLITSESGFAFTRIKKLEGKLQETGPVTVVGRYDSNWVFTRSDGRKITLPLLYYGHVATHDTSYP